MLTREQKATDYAYLWRVLKECYPVRGILKRRGIDVDRIEEEHRASVVDSADDLEFCRAIQKVFDEFKEDVVCGGWKQRFLSHLLFFEPARFYSYQKMYADFLDGDWESMKIESFKPWMDSVTQQKSIDFYSRFDKDAAHYGFYWKGQAPESEKLPENYDAVYGDQSKPNVTCRMLPGDVALIACESLNMRRIRTDREIVFDFYKKHPKVKHIIFDMRRNSGGATDYWAKILVGPTISEDISYSTYMAFPVNELNRDFFEANFNDGVRIGEPESKVRPIGELTQFPDLPAEDREQFTHFYRMDSTVRADHEHHVEAGKIWSLVSRKIYSSSEEYAVFSKITGWSTLVGERTGGDGIGDTPLHAVLPESGLVMRYSGESGINPDGTFNAECGTAPDIDCSEDEALTRCLAMIAEMEERS